MVEYHAPHAISGLEQQPRNEYLGNREVDSRRLIFGGVDGWRPWEPTMRKLHTVGQDTFPGTDMVELEVDLEEEYRESSELFV